MMDTLNNLHAYREGVMTSKEWLLLHKKNGAKLKGNILFLENGSWYEGLSKNEVMYFNNLQDWLYTDLPPIWTGQMEGLPYYVSARSLPELLEEMIAQSGIYTEEVTINDLLESDFSVIYLNNDLINSDELKVIYKNYSNNTDTPQYNHDRII